MSTRKSRTRAILNAVHGTSLEQRHMSAVSQITFCSHRGGVRRPLTSVANTRPPPVVSNDRVPARCSCSHSTVPVSAHQLQRGDIVRGDLVQRAVAPAVQRTSPAQPVSRIRVCEHAVRHGYKRSVICKDADRGTTGRNPLTDSPGILAPGADAVPPPVTPRAPGEPPDRCIVRASAQAGAFVRVRAGPVRL